MKAIRSWPLIFLAWSIGQAQVVPTTTWTDFYSDASTVNGVPIPPGAAIQAFDPQGVLCGEFTVHTAGSYGYLHVYGDDATTEQDEGASEGDTITFTIEGVEAVGAGVWTSGNPGSITLLHLSATLPPPGAAVLVAPQDGSVGIPRPAVLRWSLPELPPFGENTARVQVATDSLFSSIVVDSAGLSGDSLVVEGLAAGREYVWRVRISNSITGAGLYSNPFRFTISVTAVIALSQTALDFSETAIGDTISSLIYLRNPSEDPVTVLEIHTTHAHFSVIPGSGAVPAGDSLAIEVFYHPAGYGVHYDSLIVQSNAANSLVYADLTGSSPMPVLAVNPTAINFGTTSRDSTEIRFTSSSVNPVRIDSIFTKSRHFQARVPAFPVFLSRSDTLRIRLIFAPDSIRTFTDTLFVVENTVVPAGTVSARVRLTGTGNQVSSFRPGEQLPVAYSLSQNYPNPFNPSTTISFTLPVRAYVRITVYTVLGQEVRELVRGVVSAGEQSVVFDAQALPSGVYFYVINVLSEAQAGPLFTAIRRMVVLK